MNETTPCGKPETSLGKFICNGHYVISPETGNRIMVRNTNDHPPHTYSDTNPESILKRGGKVCPRCPALPQD